MNEDTKYQEIRWKCVLMWCDSDGLTYQIEISMAGSVAGGYGVGSYK